MTAEKIQRALWAERSVSCFETEIAEQRGKTWGYVRMEMTLGLLSSPSQHQKHKQVIEWETTRQRGVPLAFCLLLFTSEVTGL